MILSDEKIFTVDAERDVIEYQLHRASVRFQKEEKIAEEFK